MATRASTFLHLVVAIYFLLSLCVVHVTSTYSEVKIAGLGVGDGLLATEAVVSGTVVFGSNGDAYVADTKNNRIRKISNGTITTIAGNGFPGYSGDGGLAIYAELRGPNGIAITANDDIYFSETFNNVIRKISNGIITTIAGTGSGGFAGDGGAATSAKLYYPYGIALDSNGNMYIADSANHRIRKISNGIITTIAGTGSSGFAGDDGAATSAKLYSPFGIALDSNGDIFIADGNNYRIRKITISTGYITTIAGLGATGICGDGKPAIKACLLPYGVAFDSNGDMYIADSGSNRIRKITIATGITSSISDTVAFPKAITMHSNGDMYIAEDSYRIPVINKTNDILFTFAGTNFIGDNLLATSASLKTPSGVAVSSNGDIYIADTKNNRIRKISNGTITTIAGTGPIGFAGDGGLATSAKLQAPYGIALDSNGDIYIADTYNHRIRKITISTGNITTIAGTGSSGFSGDDGLATSAKLNTPTGIALDSYGNIYIADSKNHRIRKITISTGNITTIAGILANGYGGFSGDGGLATSARLNNPIGIELDSNGDIYIADTYNHRIRKITISTGNITTIAGTGSSGFSGDGGLATSAKLNNPSGIAFDSYGNIYIADSSNKRIRKITISTGNITTIAQPKSMGHPSCLFITGGKVYFTDDVNNVVSVLIPESSYCYGVIDSDPIVCNGNGSCIGNDSCICNPGANCLPSCFGISDEVCNNNGKCVSTDTCKCYDGWSGNDCSIPYCFGELGDSETVCNNRNGTCIGVDSCSCLEGFTGNECEIPICFGKLSNDTANVCSSNGECISNNTCNCNDGWNGNNCNVATCFNIPSDEKNVCSGRGSCIGFNNCECIDGWGGLDCNLFKCFGLMPNDTSVCNFRNGTCVSNNTCSCEFGWFGKSCENITACFNLNAIDQHVCGGNGICEKPDACKCYNGWAGLNCTIPICYGVESSNQTACSSHGICISNNTCQCSESWFGKECTITQCYGELSNSTAVCSFNGKCKAPNICECKEGWGGVNCSLPYCFNMLSNDGLVCSSHGQCISNNTCKCNYGWSGNNCSIVSCFGKLIDSERVCNNRNGTCIGVDSCFCLEGFTGNECEIPICFGKLSNDSVNVCNSHGQCISNNTCKCYDGWSGNDCSTPYCFGKLSDSCNNRNGTCIGVDSCLCLEGFTGNECEIPICFGKLSNDTANACSSNGECIANNTCNCNDGWSGNDCGIPYCFGELGDSETVCNNRSGTCIGVDSCSCLEGFTGNECEIPICFGKLSNDTANVCSSNGECISNNTCNCNDGWNGNNCNVATCFNIPSDEKNVCSGRGSCIGFNNCECIDGWGGLDCNLFKCYGELSNSTAVCSFNGKCKAPNICECKEGWGGVNCSLPYCFNMLSNDSFVCSSHGQCISNNTCKCNDGWSGNNCNVATCFNIPSDEKNVCSGRGSCIGFDNCECIDGWGGQNCSQPYCFNMLSNDSFVCSSHGQCISNNTCKCNYGWSGTNCSIVSCFGQYDNKLVCSGHGTCKDVDICICENGWNGNTCSVYSCNEIPNNTTNVCSGHGVCSSMNKCDCHNGFEGTWCELHYCKGQLINISTICEDQNICTPVLNCSGNGDCDSFGNCKCYSNSSKGYWKNDTCNQCQENYFGKYCLTSFSGPARFLDDFSGIFFTLNGNLKSDQNVDCSSIIPSFETFLYGSKPKCSWVFPSQFYIKFGEEYQLTPNMLIHLNMLVFDNVVGSENLISTNVILPLSPTKPTAQITQPRIEYGSCEEIIIDGSSSFSPDNKPLNFIWTISQPSNIAMEANSSYLTFPKSAPSGDYSISLKVISSLTGLESQVYQTSFKKKQISFPVVSIIGGNYVSKIVTQVPVVIGTVISLPECISNSSNSLSYNWEKITGPDLSMISNTKDLIITEFKEKTKQVYSFKLTVTSLENVDIIVSTFVYLNTTLEPFNTILYISELTTENAVISVEFSTNLDLSLESFKWNCKETTSSPCETSIDNVLNTYSQSKSTLISIPKTSQNITLLLQVRDVISIIDIIFPTSSKLVPPLINLLMVSPSDRNIMRTNEVLNLQFSISINGIEEGIDSILERVWSLNGQSIPNSDVSSMKTTLSNSNYILLDISTLEQGGEYTLQLQATNLECGLTSSYSFKFSVAKSVPICNPSASSLTAYALETKITLTLPNCKLDSNLESKFYFLDDLSGANIYLSSSPQTSTLLPLSVSGFLTILAIISDKTTGESSVGTIKINTLVPLAKTIKDIKLKQKNWASQAALLLPGDPQTNILNSGNIAIVVQEMTKIINARTRKLKVTCQNGVLNPQTQDCTCNNGYAKLDCSITTEEWIDRTELMDSLAILFSDAYYSRNKYEKISESYLISQIFGMRNILKAFDELSSQSVDNMLTILGELSRNSMNNKNLATPIGLEDLLVDLFNKLYRYRHFVLKEALTSSKMDYLRNITLDMGNFLTRNKNIGADSVNINTEFIKITSNRLYPRDLSQYQLAQSNTTSIKLPNGMMKYLESSYSKRKPLTLRLTTTNQYNGLISGGMRILSNLVSFDVQEFSLANITEYINYKMDINSISSRDSSEIVCGMLLDGIWDLSKCTRNNSDCLCSQQGSVSIILEQSHKELSKIPELSNNVPTNSTRLELLALLSIFVLVFCVIIVLIITCILRKKKAKAKNQDQTETSKEMISV